MTIKLSQIKVKAEWGAPENAEFKNSDGWTVRMTYNKRQYTFPFYMGYGHHGKEPGVKDVLPCLLSDAMCGRQDFEDFCGDMGYDSDSRKSEKIWKACQRTAKHIDRLFTESEKEKLWELVN